MDHLRYFFLLASTSEQFMLASDHERVRARMFADGGRIYHEPPRVMKYTDIPMSWVKMAASVDLDVNGQYQPCGGLSWVEKARAIYLIDRDTSRILTVRPLDALTLSPESESSMLRKVLQAMSNIKPYQDPVLVV